MTIASLEETSALIGKELDPSPWIEVDQTRINNFADATNDHQFIHVDPERAKGTPIGGTIAHGFLTLSLLSAFSGEVVPVPASAKVIVNYGFNKIRFICPGRSGKRIRARFKITGFSETQPGRWQQVMNVTVEIEGEEKPALTAEWICICYV
ncbi:MAG: MaoC family dehydratase [Xanthobacteraceae bacterium]|jgi:acyl dehydratase